MASSVARQIASVRKSAEKMVAKEPARIGAASPGDVVRQGDLYLVCLDSPPVGKPIKDRQLAPGTTQGSRHVAEGDCELLDVNRMDMAVTVNRLVRGGAVPFQLIGPAVRCIGDVTVTHPEHGHRTLPAGGDWAVVFQRDHAEEVRRVRD